MSDNVDPGPSGATPDEGSEQLRPVVTRREFMAGAGAGLAVGAVVILAGDHVRVRMLPIDR